MISAFPGSLVFIEVVVQVVYSNVVVRFPSLVSNDTTNVQSQGSLDNVRVGGESRLVESVTNVVESQSSSFLVGRNEEMFVASKVSLSFL